MQTQEKLKQAEPQVTRTYTSNHKKQFDPFEIGNKKLIKKTRKKRREEANEGSST